MKFYGFIFFLLFTISLADIFFSSWNEDSSISQENLRQKKKILLTAILVSASTALKRSPLKWCAGKYSESKTKTMGYYMKLYIIDEYIKVYLYQCKVLSDSMF